MKRYNAINAWNAACRGLPIGIDCDGDTVKPLSTFGVIVSTHIPIDVSYLPDSTNNAIVTKRIETVVQFLREMADALEGKNG